ncbi:MAG: dockerin type I repeat-containing protein [Clostridia bacterium]|nr:dockerin type I repeat-containing protein [Clostridia bacterium]
MKKIIALVLTVMMLASTLVVGISAAREYHLTEIPGSVTETKYIKCAANGHFADESPVNGVTDDFTMRIALKSSTATFGSADLGEMVGWLDGSPLINMKAGTISFVGAPDTLNYTFADNTDYVIDFVVDGDTTVYVNGTEVGTIQKNMRAIVYGVFYRYLVSEIAFIKDERAFVDVKADDYNEDDEVGYLADAPVVVERETIPPTVQVDYNRNVYDVHTDAVTDGKALYFCNSVWPDGLEGDGQAYLYTQSGIIPADKVGACVLSFDMCPLSEDAELRNYFGWLVFNQKNHTFDSLPCDFEIGTWHHIDVYCFYGNVGSVLYIDGQIAGGNAIITQVPGTQWCGGAIEIALDNIAVYESGGANGVKGELIYLEDFEDGVWQKKDSDGGGRIIDKVVTPASDVHGQYDLGSYYWGWDPDNCYAYLPLAEKDGKWELDVKLASTTDHMASYYAGGPTFKVQSTAVNEAAYVKCDSNGHFQENALRNDDFTLEVTFKTPSNVYDALGELTMWYGKSATFNMANGTIGYGGGGNVTYTPGFAFDTEYTIKWVVDGDTTVYVNDELVGTISGAMGAQIYGAFYRCYVSKISFTEGGTQFDGFDVADYNEDDTVGYLADAPVVVERTTVTNEGAVGVGDTTVPYAFAADEWYHVVLDGTVASGTDVYVDGVYVGNVATKAQARWCGHPSEIAIDNLHITADGVDYFEDFEDQAWQSADGNGRIYAYDFNYVPPEPVHDIFYFMEDDAVGGEAYIIKGGYDYTVGQDAVDVSTYYDIEALASGKQEYILDFDLALVPEIDTTGDTYLEIWSNIAYERWIVGVSKYGWNDGNSNGASEYEAFDWGTADKDNFHRVTYVFRDGTCTIYIDEQAVYSRAYSNPWTNMMIGNVYNGTAILDNVHLYTFTKDDLINQPNKLAEKATNIAADEDVKVIDLDAADFCAANGHIQYSTTRLGDPTCTENGGDKTICAICGETAKETVVPALGHSWPGYQTKNSGEGVYTWACRRGCGATVSTTRLEALTGSYDFFLDFADEIVSRNIAGIFTGSAESVSEGVQHFGDGASNYNQFDMPRQYKNEYTIYFKFRVNNLFDDNDTANYGHVLYFWCGGGGIDNQIGINFDTNEIYAVPNSGNAFDERVPFDTSILLNGDWHTLYFKVDAPGDEVDAYAGRNYADIYIDEDCVFSFNNYNFTSAYLPTDADFNIIRDFGVNFDMDEFAIGDIDLSFEELNWYDHTVGTPGDLDLNGVLGLKDIKLIKMALAGVYTLSGAEAKLADVNKDGVFNIQDYSALKALIAG